MHYIQICGDSVHPWASKRQERRLLVLVLVEETMGAGPKKAQSPLSRESQSGALSTSHREMGGKGGIKAETTPSAAPTLGTRP